MRRLIGNKNGAGTLLGPSYRFHGVSEKLSPRSTGIIPVVRRNERNEPPKESEFAAKNAGRLDQVHRSKSQLS